MYEGLIKDADAYFRALMQAKWMDEWAEEDIEILHKALQEGFEENPESMVFALSEYTIELEGYRTAEDYKSFLDALFDAFEIDAEAVVHDSNDDDSLHEDTIRIEISSVNGTAVIEIELEDDWLYDEIIDFVNDAVSDEKEIFPLPPAGSNVELVYQYTEVLDAAIELGVIPDDEYFLEE